MSSNPRQPPFCVVIEEAGSSRYKNALHYKTFDSAVKKFREREDAETKKLAARNTPQAPRAHSNSSLPDATESAQEVARQELEKLPTEIIRQVRTFHDHMQFFANSTGTVAEEATNAEVQKRSRIPKQLRELLDEISELEDIGERAKQEIMEDDDSRNVRSAELAFPLVLVLMGGIIDATHAQYRT